MSYLHAECNCCGRAVESAEVELPHATPQRKRAVGITPRGVLATAICRDCTRAAVAAWAGQPGKLSAADA